MVRAAKSNHFTDGTHSVRKKYLILWTATYLDIFQAAQCSFIILFFAWWLLLKYLCHGYRLAIIIWDIPSTFKAETKRKWWCSSTSFSFYWKMKWGLTLLKKKNPFTFHLPELYHVAFLLVSRLIESIGIYNL